MLKLFDNCKELLLNRMKLATGMESDEGEKYEFKEYTKTEGAVEHWMT